MLLLMKPDLYLIFCFKKRIFINDFDIFGLSCLDFSNSTLDTISSETLSIFYRRIQLNLPFHAIMRSSAQHVYDFKLNSMLISDGCDWFAPGLSHLFYVICK